MVRAWDLDESGSAWFQVPILLEPACINFSLVIVLDVSSVIFSSPRTAIRLNAAATKPADLRSCDEAFPKRIRNCSRQVCSSCFKRSPLSPFTSLDEPFSPDHSPTRIRKDNRLVFGFRAVHQSTVAFRATHSSSGVELSVRDELRAPLMFRDPCISQLSDRINSHLRHR